MPQGVDSRISLRPDTRSRRVSRADYPTSPVTSSRVVGRDESGIGSHGCDEVNGRPRGPSSNDSTSKVPEQAAGSRYGDV